MRVVLCTSPVDKAPELARRLVEERYAACVNIVPKVRSFYVWQGKLEDDEEALMIVKTTAERIESLTRALRQWHPYDVPEIVSLPLEATEGNPDYLEWLRASVKS